MRILGRSNIETGTAFWNRRSAVAFIAALGIFLGAADRASAETKSWVISWFGVAVYSVDGDCPDGVNPQSEVFYRQYLGDLGYSSSDIDGLIKDLSGVGAGKLAAIVAHRGNKGTADVYAHPDSVPDPHVHTVQGQFGYGFNLDGKGAASPNSFEDPDTHETGINNQLFRAIGCTGSQRAKPPYRSAWAATQWDLLLDQMPAWIITVTGDDLTAADTPVTVSIDRALEPIARNAAGGVRADMTFRPDRNARSHNVFKGRIQNKVLTIEPGELNLLGDPYLVPEFHLTKAHLRLKLEDDGGAKGLLGGYMPWYPFYWSLANSGYTLESITSMDMPGLYYALKRLADAQPSPSTGQNAAISAAYSIEAVPAYLASEGTGHEDRTATAQDDQRSSRVP